MSLIDWITTTFPLWKIILFLVISSGFIMISRASLFKPRSHGFYRFFAWELILILFLQNAPFWFKDPLSWNQLLSWFLLFISIIPLIWGLILLVKHGKPVKNQGERSSLLSFEKTSHLVTSGIYRFIRHPLYCSLLLLSWGIFMKSPSRIGAVLTFLTSAFLLVTALMEEREMVAVFGTAYHDYMKTSKRFIPFIF